MGLFGGQLEGTLYPTGRPTCECGNWDVDVCGMPIVDPCHGQYPNTPLTLPIPPDYAPIPTLNRQPPIAGNGPVTVTGPYSYPGAAKTKTAGTGLAMAAAAALIFFLR